MAVGAAAEAVAEAWNRLTVTAATNAEALGAAADCARLVSSAGVVSVRHCCNVLIGSQRHAGRLP